MQLRLESRPVGDVLVIQCQGRIVAGNEVYTLHAYVGDSFVKYGNVVLQLEQVEFVDSSGLGALVRLLQAARSKGGDLKLSGVPPKIRKTLEMTNLLSQFETYDSVEEAIRPPIWARGIREEKPGTQDHACSVFPSRRMWARSCGRYCAVPDTTP